MLRIQLLGDLQVTYDTIVITHQLRPRAQRLLAYLLLQRHAFLTRERLAFTLWPDHSEKDALGTLRRALSDLRSSLPQPDAVEWTTPRGGEVRWNPAAPYWLDIEEFERLLAAATPDALQAAVALYTGDLLTSWGDDWVLVEREHLRQRQYQALRQLVAHHRALGDYAPALALARAALALDPFAEATYRDLMTLHYAAGDRAAALAEYDRLAALLRAELGVEPMAETQALRAAIAQGALPIARAAPTPALPLASPLLAPRPPLIGRQAELAQLEALWARVEAGAGRFALISGEAGVGKSHLALTLADHAMQRGGLALIGHSYEFEGALPYQAIVEMLRSAASRLQAAPLPDPYRVALARLAPDVLGAMGSPAVEGAGLPEEMRTYLFEALLQAFMALARQQPVLLLFEDVHWAAESTLDWLTYIAPRLKHSRLLVVMTYRTGEVNAEHAVVRLERRFTREGVVASLSLQPLSRDAHRALVAHLSGLTGEPSARVADRLFRETAGHPFFLHELVRGLVDAGQLQVGDGPWTGAFVQAGHNTPLVFPDSLRATINERVDRMTARARLFLKTAAVVGRTFQYDIVRRAGGWSEEVTLEALEETLARDFVQPGPTDGEFVFAHHLMQEAIYASLTAPRRAYIHRLVADALVEAAARQAPAARQALAGGIVHHALRSERDRLIFDWAPLAAAHATRLHAYADALHALDAASNALDRLRHDPTFDLTAGERQHIAILLDRALLMPPVGRPMEEYGRVVHAVADLLARYPDDALYARYCLQRAAYLSWRSQYADAAASALEAHTCFMQLGDTRRAAQSLVVAARYRLTISQSRASRHLTHQALDLYRSIGDATGETWCLHSLAWIDFNQGDIQSALDHLTSALALSEQRGDKRNVANTYYGLATAWDFYHHADRVQDYAEKSVQLYREVGYAQTAYRSMLLVAEAHRTRGDLALARPIYGQVYAEAQAHHDSWLEGWAAQNLGRVALELGDFQEAEQRLQYAYRLRQQTGELHNQVSALTWLGHLRLAQGDPVAALEYTQPAVTQLDALWGEVYVWETPDVLMTHALALQGTGRADEARVYRQRAYDTLKLFATQIEDSAVRDIFLAYPVNAHIIAAWRTAQDHSLPH